VNRLWLYAVVTVAVLVWIMVSSSDRYDWTPVWLVGAFFVGLIVGDGGRGPIANERKEDE
jgi:uncharacterized membrane protein